MMHYVPVLKDLKKLFPEFESDLLLKTYLMYDLNGEKIHWEFSDVPHLFISHSKEKKRKKHLDLTIGVLVEHILEL